MASIERRSGNWSVYWRQGGRAGTKQRATFTTEKYALRAKELAEAHRHNIAADDVKAIVLGLSPTATDDTESDLPTVTEWADTWLDSRTSIDPGTRARYRRQLDTRILPVLGDHPLDHVTGTHIANLITTLRAELDDATVDRYMAPLTGLFGYAVKEGHITSSPVDRTDYVRERIAHDDDGDDGDDHCYLSPAEYQLIRAHMRPRGKPVIDVLAGTGARWSEATAVAATSVTVGDEAVVRIHRAWKRDSTPGAEKRWYLGPTKGRTRRSVTVAPDVAAVLKEHLAGDRSVGPDNLLLSTTTGTRLDNSAFRSQFWVPAVDAASRCADHLPEVTRDGLPARNLKGFWRPGAVSTCDCPGRLRQTPTLHDLRHSHTAWLIAAGMPMLAISKRLGHRSTEVTERIYAGVLPVVHTAMATALDGMVSGRVSGGSAIGETEPAEGRPA